MTTLPRLAVIITFATFCLSFGLAVPVAHAAEPIIQELVREESSVRFGLHGKPLGVAGRFRNFRGKLALDHELRPVRAFFSVDLSAVQLDPQPGMEFISFEPLFRRIPQPVGTFESDAVRSLGPRRYEFQGTWRRGAKVSEVRIPFELSYVSAAQSRLRIELSEEIKQWDPTIPLPVAGPGVRSELDSSLVFSRTAAQPVK